MKIAIACAGFLLAGCATPPHIQAQRLSSPVLCYGTYAGNVEQQQYARQELSNRRFNCTERDVEMGRQEWASLQAGRQAQADRDLATGIYLLNAGRAPPPPAPSGVTCRTINLGYGQSRTECN
jgi:hypothetical protein